MMTGNEQIDLRNDLDAAYPCPDIDCDGVVEYETTQDVIDSQLEQIDVLRPVYDAAKILQGAVLNGTHRQKALAIKTLWGATESAARYLEDSDE
jgi:hypothetical protein